jgi:hypothetical protein
MIGSSKILRDPTVQLCEERFWQRSTRLELRPHD